MGLGDKYLRDHDALGPCAGTVIGPDFVIAGEHRSGADCAAGPCANAKHGHDSLRPACPGRGYWYADPPLQSTGGMFVDTFAATVERRRFGPSPQEAAEEARESGQATAAAADEITRQPTARRFGETDLLREWRDQDWRTYTRRFQSGRGKPAERTTYQRRTEDARLLSKHYEYAGLEPRQRLGACDGGSNPFQLWVGLTWKDWRPFAAPALAVVPEDVLRSVYRVGSCRRVIVEDGATRPRSSIPSERAA